MQDSFDADEVAFNLMLFKRLRFYHIFAPHSPKVFNYNAYRLGLAVVIVPSFVFNMIFGSVGFFVELEDAIDEIGVYQIVFTYLNYFLSFFKLYMFVYNANEIWDLLDVTRVGFMTSGPCLEHIGVLHDYRRLSTKITDFLCVFITFTILLWWSFPIFVNDFLNTEPGDVTRRFENVINFRYPLSIKVYNRYFYFIYVIEATTGVIIEYGILITDVILISISFVLIAHYEIHNMAFVRIGLEQKSRAGNEIDFNSHYEDFKSVVIEQQKLNLKLQSYYSIVWPIIISTVAVTSGSIIILSFSFVMIFMTAENVSILRIVKLGTAFLFLCIELFIHCYLLDTIQIKKRAVASGMYSCNWTLMDLKFKKLLLSSMRMDDANQLKIKITEARIVNLQFFSDVMLTCYNIVSIMLKTQMENSEPSEGFYGFTMMFIFFPFTTLLNYNYIILWFSMMNQMSIRNLT